MSSTLADSNLVLEKTGHVELTEEEKEEAEKKCREIKMMIEKSVKESDSLKSGSAETPAPVVPVPASPQEEPRKTDIRKELGLPDPEEFYQRAKDNLTGYDRARKYERKLFRVYLNGLIDCMASGYPEISRDSGYKTFEDKKTPGISGGKGRTDCLNTRDGLFFMIDRVSQKTPSLRKYRANCAEDLFRNWRFRKIYSETNFFTFLATADCGNILYDMIIESVRDLIPYERSFSIEGTEFVSVMKNDSGFNRHESAAYTTKDGRTVKESDLISLQALTAQISNVVVIPRIHCKSAAGEQEEILGMVNEALKEGFKVKRLFADTAYSGKEYRNELGGLGIDYYCRFPSNVLPPALNDESPWAKQYRFQQEHPDEFAVIYHSRSTVENVCGAIKILAGEKLTSGTVEGYYKEVYCKVIVYNIFRMIRQLFINGIVPHFVNPDEIAAVVKSP